MTSCRKCPEYWGSFQGSCSYSCKKKKTKFGNSKIVEPESISAFCKKLFQANGILVRPNIVYNNLKYLGYEYK